MKSLQELEAACVVSKRCTDYWSGGCAASCQYRNARENGQNCQTLLARACKALAERYKAIAEMFIDGRVEYIKPGLGKSVVWEALDAQVMEEL